MSQGVSMSEKPIIFTAESVQAILDGRKTVTRQVIKPQPNGQPFQMANEHEWWIANHSGNWMVKCPYAVGDELWVKETWQKKLWRGYWNDEEEFGGTKRYEVTYKATPRIGIRYPGILRPVDRMVYLDESTELKHHCFGWPIKWRSPLFMPRWASRLQLVITAVRVERVQDITDLECFAEGIRQPDDDDFWTPSKGFACLWDSINKRRGYGWEENPFVWVIEFEA